MTIPSLKKFSLLSLLITLAVTAATLTMMSEDSDKLSAQPTVMPAHPSNPAAGPIGQAGSTETPQAGGLAQFVVALRAAHESVATSYVTVEPILRESCYDCHSSETRYPWYYKIPGIKGMMDKDIRRARHNVDFSAGFPFDSVKSQLKSLEEIRKEVKEVDMPPLLYRVMHWNAKIDGPRQDTLFAWIDSSIATLKNVYTVYNYPLPGGSPEKKDED